MESAISATDQLWKRGMRQAIPRAKAHGKEWEARQDLTRHSIVRTACRGWPASSGSALGQPTHRAMPLSRVTCS
eukprot:scaffold19235_cov126-Isochrysis_galbana.AAC.8